MPAADGQIYVDLRLQLKKLKEDIASAQKMIKDGLNKTLGVGGGSGKDKVSDAQGKGQDELDVKVRRVTKSLKDQLDVWKKIQNFRKPRVIDNSGSTATTRVYGPGATVQMTGGGLATTPPGGGVPPIIPPPFLPKGTPKAGDWNVFWRRMITGGMGAARGGAYGNIIGANQMFGAFGNTAAGGQVMGRAGLAGAGGAALATGALLAAILALKLSIDGAKLVIQESVRAAERARELYARSISNGLGLSFNAQRSNLAQVMGVSESEVFNFGQVLAILNPRLKEASKIQADTARTLAPLAYDMRILQIDLEALFSSLATKVVPIMRVVVNTFDELVKAAQGAGEAMTKIVALMYAISPIKPDLNKAKNTAEILLAAALGPFGPAFIRGLGDSQAKLPSPTGFMKQMPTSPWEKMGLVTSMSGGNQAIDYMKRTAQATEQTAKHLEHISGIPRSTPPFNMDPTTSNP